MNNEQFEVTLPHEGNNEQLKVTLPYEGNNEQFEVILPYEGNIDDAIKSAEEYSLKLKNIKRDGIDVDNIDIITGITVATFVGSKNKILELLEEFGGEQNALDTMDEPYGRISKLVIN